MSFIVHKKILSPITHKNYIYFSNITKNKIKKLPKKLKKKIIQIHF